MALIRWIIGAALAAIAALFAVSNLHTVQVYVTPVHPALEMPLYLISLGLMAAGFLIGCVVAWLNMDGLRSEKRQQRRKIKDLEKKLGDQV